MAIKLNTISKTAQGFEVLGAYCRVEDVKVTKASAYCILRKYKDNSGVLHFAEDGISYPYALDGGNPIKQAYDYLKTLPEFAGATDC
jgi:hypothetical protein